MKAEERHRLQENELQRLAEHARERTRPFFERYGTTLLLALAAVLLIVAAIVWWVRSSGAGSSAGWSELAAVFRKGDPNAQDFANVAELFPDTPAAVWATLYEGELHLTTGVESLFTDREGAARDLADARAAFEKVLDNPKRTPELEVRALYGLARTLEASSDGDLAPAIERYEQIVQSHDGTVYATLARKRLESLKTAEAKEFYAWFSKQKPAVQDPLQRPSDGSTPFNIPGLTPPGGPSFTPTAPAGSGTSSSPASPGATTPIEAPRPGSGTPAGASAEPQNAAPSTVEAAPSEPGEAAAAESSATPPE